MDRTNAERQRRYIERLKARAGKASDAAAEIAALKEALAAARLKTKAKATQVRANKKTSRR
jgi:hypothetical protein